MIRNVARRVPFARATGRAMREAWRALPRRAQPPQPLILMYHRVIEDRFDPWGLGVSTAHFAEQIRWLRDRRIPLALDEFADRHANGTLPDRAVAVTFDDAYSCAASVAAPLLEELEVPATIFLPPALIERGEPFWWDELEAVVIGHDPEMLRLAGEEFMIGRKRPGDSRWEPGAPPASERQRAFYALWSKLRPMPPGKLRAAMDELRDQASPASSRHLSKRPMTAAEVKSTASDRIRFGSHAISHPWLPGLDSGEKAREIGDSVERCTALTGLRPTTFAYPYGDYDAESENLVRKAGFVCACTTQARPVAASSNFALPRMAVGNMGSRRFGWAIRSLATQA